jgi:ABC-2 type transport system permease protein
VEAYIFGSSLREFLRFRRLWPWLVVVVATFGIATVYHRVDPSTTPSNAYVLLSATLVFRILALSAAIFSSAIIAQEVEQRTIVYLLTRPVARWKLLIFRTLAAVVVVFGLSSLVAIATSLATVGPNNPYLWRDVMALAVGSVAYMSLFVFVSLLMNRSMIVCLLFAFVWETSVPNMPGDLYRLTISGYLSSIAQRPSLPSANGLFSALGGMLGVNTISPGAALACVLGLSAVCLGAGAYWFSHFEYMAREDAE